MLKKYVYLSARKNHWIIILFFITLILNVFSVRIVAVGSKPLEDLRDYVAKASKLGAPWEGPRNGPEITAGKRVALICEDLRNGGILGVAEGVREAAEVAEWHVVVFNAKGTSEGNNKAISKAVAFKPDGVILIGGDAKTLEKKLAPFAKQGIPIVGWHVGSKEGVIDNSPVAVNISTNPIEVAQVTASAAIVDSGGEAGVVIFTDSRFKIATTKANIMAALIQRCEKCEVLEIQNVAISECAKRIPGIVKELLEKYGKRWTHALAINDIFFDYAVPEIIKYGDRLQDIRFLSAGDGSPSAFMRIQTGVFQIATVAEPLNAHGWQLVDELNRLMASKPVSGYVMPVNLINRQNIMYGEGSYFKFDPDNNYRDIYRAIWKQQR